MVIGVPKEIKDNEFRVGMVPSGVADLAAAGHEILIERGAGAGVGIGDSAYEDKGAVIVPSAREIYSRTEMVVKVKEPQLPEIALFKKDLILFSFLHLAPKPEITAALLAGKTIGIAYETVQEADGGFPVLKPMSCIAGKISVQIGANLLKRDSGGRGVLLGGTPGVPGGTVVVVGAGTVGSNALETAVGMGARVIVLDINLQKLEHLDELYGNRIETRYANKENLAESAAQADLLIGAVLVPGALAPRIVTREMVRGMKAGSVLVDVAVDQGGCCETTRATCHSRPTFVEEGVIHYGVSNIPGVVPVTSTYALTNASITYVKKIAGLGVPEIFRRNSAIAAGVNLYRGKVTCRRVSQILSLEYWALDKLL